MAARPASTPDAALRTYRAKRDFKITSEPAEGGVAGTDRLTFVVQKHWASRLHYDFRLELDGSLMSWAVPKGPSFDPKDKRVAIHVEDHPLSYAGFEGTIPAKQYGAGKVIVWDKGVWSPVGDPHEGLRKGDLKFDLHGHKLHGRWVLVRMKSKGERQEPWLLIKERDAHVRPAADFSVVDELPDSVQALAMPKAAPAASAPAPTKKAMRGKATARTALPPEARPAALPDKLAPQLAVLADSPPRDAAAWVYEIKFDGYRMLARIDGDTVKLVTRNGNDWTAKLGALHRSLVEARLPPGWYDGEIVVPNALGIPDFGALQNSFDSSRTENIVFYLFDLPYFDGHDLRAAPLESRRALLQSVLADAASPRIRFSEVFDAPAHSMVASASALGLEGIVGKRKGTPYRSARSADWIKLKCHRRQEFVIAGYTDPAGSRTDFGALLLGVYDADGTLQYAGNVGTGFSQRDLGEIKRKLDAAATDTPSFPKGTPVEGRPHWVAPKLVGEVSFGEWTRTGRVRHAVFRGLRTDKDARAIVREKEIAMDESASAPTAPMAAASKRIAAKPAAAPTPEGLAGKVRVTNPERVIDPSTGITKIELVRYFDLVGDLMMTHLKGRPVSLVRAPSGIAGELFFQKHAEIDKLPGVRQLDAALFPEHPPMIEIASRQGILSVAQWNTVEIHTQNGCAKSFDTPDRMVFDLDPGAGVAWRQVQEAAQLVHAFLDELGLPSFLKTSGGKGLHVLVPIRKGHDWDAVKGFSQAVVAHMAATVPQRFVAKSGPKNRVGKIFIDYLRNGLGATTVAAWSARSRPGLGISVPVDWSELMQLRGGDHWTVRSAHERLDRGNEPWAGYAKAARSLRAAMRKLDFEP
ncbi:MAG: DNA ligase D [Burkholderiaceae bacterium]